jgi:hypothetical protein
VCVCVCERSPGLLGARVNLALDFFKLVPMGLTRENTKNVTLGCLKREQLVKYGLACQERAKCVTIGDATATGRAVKMCTLRWAFLSENS